MLKWCFGVVVVVVVALSRAKAKGIRLCKKLKLHRVEHLICHLYPVQLLYISWNSLMKQSIKV